MDGHDDPVLLHIGYAKTATTTLQQLVFPRVGTLIGRQDVEYRRVADLVVDADASEYRADDVRVVIERWCSDAARPVISDEVLGGSIWTDPSTSPRTAQRLHELVPDARVLICVRNQATALPSIYGLFLKKGGYSAFSRLLDDRVPRKQVNLDFLRWDSLVQTYQRLFGSERVEVVPYELLVTDPRSFLERIAVMMGAGLDALAPDALEVKNRSLSPGWQLVLRSANRLSRRTPYNPHPPLPLTRATRVRGLVERCDDRVALGARGGVPRRSRSRFAELLASYEESNARLEASTGLDLAAFGYPLPAGHG